MRLQLGVFLALSAIVLPARAQEASILPHIVGTWRLSDEVCQFGPPSLVISAPKADQLAINGVLYPVADISIDGTEPSRMYFGTKRLNFDRPFTFEMLTDNTLVLRSVTREPGDIVVANCHYIKQGKQISQPHRDAG